METAPLGDVSQHSCFLRHRQYLGLKEFQCGLDGNKMYLKQTLEYKIAEPYQSFSFSKGFAIKKIRFSHGHRVP